MKMQTNNLELALLHAIRGDNADIVACIARLYTGGDISDKELSLLVGRYISLAEYNDILDVE